MPDRTNTTRVLFLPDDQSVILIEVNRPAETLLAEIRTGQWTPPEPYGILLTAPEESARTGTRAPAACRTPLRTMRFGRLVVILPVRGLPLGISAPAETPAIRLSARQRQVLEGLCDGLNNKQIAERMGLKQRTVAYHVAEIKARLGAGSRAQAVSRAAALGFLGHKRESGE